MKEFHKKESPVVGYAGFGGGVSYLSGIIKLPTYVDDVFSTYLYEGNDNARNIPNGIDNTDKALVWTKNRDNSVGNRLVDTETGPNTYLESDSPDDLRDDSRGAEGVTSFNSNGYALGAWVNEDGFNRASFGSYVSWNFKAAPGFFDVVTYSGSGSGTKTIPHNLGSVPGMIICKGINGGSDWSVYHRSLNGGSSPEDWYLSLNHEFDESNAVANWGGTAPTSTEFTVGDNANGSLNYVAYLFAHDEPVFGTDEDESIIKCGSYTGGGSTSVEVNLGFEPQWVLIKSVDTGYSWWILDNMRGIFPGDDAALKPNSDGSEQNPNMIDLTPTGFKTGTNANANKEYDNFIYMAIRRPNKPPESAINVFAIDTGNNSSTIPCWDSGFPVDFAMWAKPDYTYHRGMGARLLGTKYLKSNESLVEANDPDLTWDSNVGWGKAYASTFYSYMFKRAPGFMDVVTYTGTGTNSAGTEQVVNHNLGETPELVIVKNRDAAKPFFVWSIYMTEQYRMQLDDTAQELNGGDTYWQDNITFTPTQFGLGYGVNTNKDGDKHVAYLFASLAGISKIGTYSGYTGYNVDVDCEFTNNARFVLIKRKDAEVTGTNSSGWYVWDTLRGIGNGNDPYFTLNSDTPQVTTDYIDLHPENKGFRVNASAPASLNVTGGTYLFLAIA